jgi:hypothetical protein
MAKIEGREKLRAKFKALPQAARDAIGKAVRQSAEDLVGLQQRLVPIEKGTLRDSIRFEIFEGEEFRATVIAGGTAATRRELRKGSGRFTDEAVLAEFGTHAHRAGGKFRGALIPAEPPRAFFYPAWRAMKKPIKSRISRAITSAAKKVAAG